MIQNLLLLIDNRHNACLSKPITQNHSYSTKVFYRQFENMFAAIQIISECHFTRKHQEVILLWNFFHLWNSFENWVIKIKKQKSWNDVQIKAYLIRRFKTCSRSSPTETSDLYAIDSKNQTQQRITYLSFIKIIYQKSLLQSNWISKIF